MVSFLPVNAAVPRFFADVSVKVKPMAVIPDGTNSSLTRKVGGLVSVPKGIVPHDNIRVCPECHAQWNKALNEHFLKGTPLYKENI